MSEFLRFVLLGLGIGALYGLTAQGLVLIYRGSGVINLAQGAFAMLGAFLYYESTDSRGWPTAVGTSSATTIATPASPRPGSRGSRRTAGGSSAATAKV